MVSPSASDDDEEERTLTDDGPDHLDAIGQRPLALRDLEDRLLLTEDRITQVLTRTDGACKFIEDIMRIAQIEERHGGVVGGVTSAHLRIGKEALEQLKSDYLQFFMYRELVLKFVEDKAGEVEELRYQLSLVRSSPLTTKTPSDLAVMIQAGVSVTHDMSEEPLVTNSDEEHSVLSVLRRSHDSKSWDCARRIMSPFLWKTY
jgi:hypothetical protein